MVFARSPCHADFSTPCAWQMLREANKDPAVSKSFVKQMSDNVQFVTRLMDGMSAEEKKLFVSPLTAPEEHLREIVHAQLFFKYLPPQGGAGAGAAAGAAGQKKVMRVRVKVPEHLSAGDSFAVQIPDGRTLQVKIPEGVTGGQVLELSVKSDPAATAGGAKTGTDIPAASKEEQEAAKKKSKKSGKKKKKSSNADSPSSAAPVGTIGSVVLGLGAVVGLAGAAFFFKSAFSGADSPTSRGSTA